MFFFALLRVSTMFFSRCNLLRIAHFAPFHFIELVHQKKNFHAEKKFPFRIWTGKHFNSTGFTWPILAWNMRGNTCGV
jgi:hypothetical protein